MYPGRQRLFLKYINKILRVIFAQLHNKVQSVTRMFLLYKNDSWENRKAQSTDVHWQRDEQRPVISTKNLPPEWNQRFFRGINSTMTIFQTPEVGLKKERLLKHK